MIGGFGEPKESMRLAQGVKSKTLHFAARMCGPCNSTITQPADREFDIFHKAARDHMDKGEDPKLVFKDKRYAVGSEAYLDVFRYFAKLLCCHLADVGGPRPRHLSSFVLRQARTNCVWLDLDHDWIYKQISAEFGAHQYAAHGGMVIYGDGKTGVPNASHSTLTVGRCVTSFSRVLTGLSGLNCESFIASSTIGAARKYKNLSTSQLLRRIDCDSVCRQAPRRLKVNRRCRSGMLLSLRANMRKRCPTRSGRSAQ